ncbi:hypothetical protein OG321_38680 [Streptomyces sp. NBC_00424]|nr:hypothetical protein [Streptomyces sp. NBC_00424]MCX5078373.1 hypothetical protein [Streptomyces sp. NBC_00424]
MPAEETHGRAGLRLVAAALRGIFGGVSRSVTDWLIRMMDGDRL